MDLDDKIREALHKLGLGGNSAEAIETLKAQIATLEGEKATLATDNQRLTAENAAHVEAGKKRLAMAKTSALAAADKTYRADTAKLTAIKEKIEETTDADQLASLMALTEARDRARRAALASKGQEHKDLPAIQARIDAATDLSVIDTIADLYAPGASAVANASRQTEVTNPATNADEDFFAKVREEGEKANGTAPADQKKGA